ncbi:F0F1 ATP synthase subunit B [Mycoplasmopsis glycophila]|uniref:ATP synthase subunit b n=1 Tax=Mycoplasmopsis glycophila TaxID=171285 RepID=A0A449AUZ7_9BACT|nr:F0F1 ATP synthase subunit B [Mycoplasmopsis glycophila]VEU70313.1 ATP synthase subunit b [Mycoplasmopsis glycophila]
MLTNINLLLAENESTVSKIAEKFNQIFPSWPMMLATIISFVIVFTVLTKLVYKPVKKMIQERQNYIQENINQSVKQTEISLAKLDEANANLINSRKQADIIITKAKLRAEKVSDLYTLKAKAQSKRLLEETHLDIEAQKREFEENSKKYVVQVATELADKILKREISQETQSEIIDKFLNSDKEVDEI